MKVIHTSGARKRAVARATAKAGKGVVTINKVPLELYQPHYVQLKINEALVLAGAAVKKMDIAVTVAGGGQAGQADAIRLAIGRAVVDFTGSDDIKRTYLEYDRQLLVADVRRKETSKPNCLGKARSRRQKSYR